MKGVFIISPNAYQDIVADILIQNGFQCTKMSTTGAFLNNGQSTIFTVTNDENINKILRLLHNIKNNKPVENLPNIFVFTTEVSDTFTI